MSEDSTNSWLKRLSFNSRRLDVDGFGHASKGQDFDTDKKDAVQPIFNSPVRQIFLTC